MNREVVTALTKIRDKVEKRRRWFRNNKGKVTEAEFNIAIRETGEAIKVINDQIKLEQAQ